MLRNGCSFSRGSWLAAAALTVAAVAGTAQASVVAVNIQFQGSGTGSGGTATSFNGQQGAYTGDGVTSPTWNVVKAPSPNTVGTSSNLLTSTGTASSVGATYNFEGSYNFYTQTSPSNALLDSTTNSVSGYGNNVTLTGLTDNGSYQLYLYAANGGYGGSGTLFDNFVGGTATAAAGSNNYTAPTKTGTFTENVNYVVFDITASATGTIGIIPMPISGDPTYQNAGHLSGLQLISGAEAVPEPTPLALMGVGALGLLLIGRKKRTTEAKPRRPLA